MYEAWIPGGGRMPSGVRTAIIAMKFVKADGAKGGRKKRCGKVSPWKQSL
jgi:hypothetical protein